LASFSSGKLVTHVVFKIRTKRPIQIKIDDNPDEHDALKAMLDLGLSSERAHKVLSEWWLADANRVRWHLVAVKKQKAANKIKNSAAWFLAGIKNDYRPEAAAMRDREKAARNRGTYSPVKDERFSGT
jgi:hypothetical protein